MALDATLWDEPTTGIALYSRQLYRALSLQLTVERWGARRTGEHPRGRTGATLYAMAALGRELARERPRLFHALSNFNLPLTRVPGVPLVLTVHDLVPVELPDTVSLPFRLQFVGWLTRSLAVADHVICVSHFTRARLLARFPVDPARVSVVHHGIDHVTHVPPPDRTTAMWLDALGLPPRWVLYAGALDARKNVRLLLQASRLLHRRGTPVTVVLAGQKWFGGDRDEAEARRLREEGADVRVLGYLEASVFYALMRRAPVFVFPSRLEGFGLPPLEAMALGVPTIVSTAGALPEVCGEGAVAVDPDDAPGLADHIDAILSSAATREELGRRARSVASRYTWERAAREVMEAYSRAEGSRG